VPNGCHIPNWSLPSATHIRILPSGIVSDPFPDPRRLATACSDANARCWRVPIPVTGAAERIACWIRVATEREFDDGDAIRPIDQLALWDLRRRLQDLGGPPVK
jgi:hypothetical protein